METPMAKTVVKFVQSGFVCRFMFAAVLYVRLSAGTADEAYESPEKL